MDIAIPLSCAADEQRVALTPVGVSALTQAGHAVFVESGAGQMAGFVDSDYIGAGAQIVYDSEAIYRRGKLLVTVDGITGPMLRLIRPDQIVCGFLLLTVMRRHALAQLARSGASTLSYELIQDEDGALPVLIPMSEIAGRLLPQIAAHLLETASGGRGILLGPVPGIPSAEVVILGAGTVGTNAADGFSAWGVQTTLLDHKIENLRRAEQLCHGRITTRLSSASAVAHVAPFADVLIGAIQTPGIRPAQLLSRALVARMKPRSVIIDASIDQGGCIASSRPTTLRDPTYIAEGVLHYAVPNIPSLVARTASHALNNALLPYIQQIADRGIEQAMADNTALARGVGLLHGLPQTAQTIVALNAASGLAAAVGGSAQMEIAS